MKPHSRRNTPDLGGYSSGGTFSHYAASQLNDILASVSPVSSSPFLGFGDVPLDPPISLIGFNGLQGHHPLHFFNVHQVLSICSPTIAFIIKELLGNSWITLKEH